jgi:hypothetical protein
LKKYKEKYSAQIYSAQVMYHPKKSMNLLNPFQVWRSGGSLEGWRDMEGFLGMWKDISCGSAWSPGGMNGHGGAVGQVDPGEGFQVWRWFF